MALLPGERYAFHVGIGYELDELDDDEQTDPGPCACAACSAKVRLRDRIAEARVVRFIRVQAPLSDGPAWTVYLQRDDAATAKGEGATEDIAIESALAELQEKR